MDDFLGGLLGFVTRELGWTLRHPMEFLESTIGMGGIILLAYTIFVLVFFHPWWLLWPSSAVWLGMILRGLWISSGQKK